jgi:Flp pilus assembly protein TadD
MKSWKMVCIMSLAALLGGCTSDLVSPPYEDHPNIQAAELARRRGDVPQAIHDYRDIIKECPGCEKAYVGLGMALIDANAVVEAKLAFEKAIALFPRSSGAYKGLGFVYLLIDQPENAINSFDTALKLNPRNPTAFNGYGLALDMVNEHETAQANYRAAMELEPTNISYESNLALSLALCGNEYEAIHILERLVRCPNATPRIRQNLALAYGLAGDMKMAKKVGRLDLSDEMVANNVTYFEAIQQTKEYSGLIPKDHTTPLNETRKWQERH